MKTISNVAKRQMKKRVLTIDEFCDLFSVGRTKAYELMDNGRLKFVRIGKRRYIPSDAAEALLKAS